MSADEVRGPRHAAPRKPLFTRFHVPSGKAIALAAMPTAVLMGMGFTPTLALADGNDGPPANSLTADEYKECLEVVEGAEKEDATASPTPSATASDSASPEPDATREPGTSASAGADPSTAPSSDSGSDDEDEPAPAPSATAGGQESDGQDEPAPSPSGTDRGFLDDVGDALKDVFTPGDKETAASPTPSASASAAEEKGEDAAGAVQETAEKVTGTVEDTVEGVGDKVSEAADDAEDKAEEAAGEATATPGATASPSPSETSTTDPEDCPVATDAEGGVDNRILLPDDPWFLNASSLTLKGADYQGIVEVRTASGATKKVLKYVVSDGTDIGDLHQTVKDKQSGKTHHVQAAEGSMSTIRDGDTVMYTEKISGKLLGLIPITFDPEHPPPLNIPLIYFTDVTVQQAGQFGGTLHIPGLQQYVTD
ncbi:hypothetical protein GCM10010451_52570 [Streptomyces virens]|uniref:Membrane-bound hydrophilic protein n=1 Tax=Streptomyces virens TaxID=285572 RepID=A0ABP6PY28_9ACTN|nr:hypothetical protein [Streptomyces calvus]MBA8974816.1 uncharacterized protein YjbJ (UPF0337 family) [Streptomyces calvus]MYS31342.1 hypothetical protein [Streptomyces sp. SID7804]